MRRERIDYKRDFEACPTSCGESKFFFLHSLLLTHTQKSEEKREKREERKRKIRYTDLVKDEKKLIWIWLLFSPPFHPPSFSLSPLTARLWFQVMKIVSGKRRHDMIWWRQQKLKVPGQEKKVISIKQKFLTRERETWREEQVVMADWLLKGKHRDAGFWIH